MTIKNIPKTFVGFLVASCLIWLLITFSKEYSTTLSYTIQFSDVPQNKVLQNSDKYEIEFTAEGTGFKLLRFKIGTNILNINASNHINSNKNNHYLVLKKVKSLLQEELPNGITLEEISKDTLFVNMGVLSFKKVKVESNLTLNFHKGYELISEVKLIPDSILLSGKEEELKKINTLTHKKLTLSDIKKSFSKEIKIELPSDFTSLKVNVDKVKITGEVDKFTEGKIEVPISIINLPENVKLTTLSENVEITYIISLSRFSEVTPASFRVVCDYSATINNKLDYLVPKVIQAPKFVKSYKILPPKIDFLIQK